MFIDIVSWNNFRYIQKQPPRRVLKKRCSQNMQQIYRRTPMPKCDFNKVGLLCNFIEITLWHGCSPVNLLHIFRTPFTKNTSGRLLLYIKLNQFLLVWKNFISHDSHKDFSLTWKLNIKSSKYLREIEYSRYFWYVWKTLHQHFWGI